MEIRKIAATVLVGGGMTALAVAGMGTASATEHGGYPGGGGGPKPPATSTPNNTNCSVIAKCVTVTKPISTSVSNTGTINQGNILQGGGLLNGNINNPQLNNNGANVTQTSTNTVKKSFGEAESKQVANPTGNFSNNSTSVNSASSSHNSVGGVVQK